MGGGGDNSNEMVSTPFFLSVKYIVELYWIIRLINPHGKISLLQLVHWICFPFLNIIINRFETKLSLKLGYDYAKILYHLEGMY